MTTATRQELINRGVLKPAAAASSGVKADPRAIRERSHEQLGQRTERAMAILRAAMKRREEVTA